MAYMGYLHFVILIVLQQIFILFNFSFFFFFFFFTQWDMTPLMLAIKGGHKELTRYLVVKVKAELNIQAMKVRNSI